LCRRFVLVLYRRQMEVPKGILQGLVDVGWLANGMSSFVSSNLVCSPKIGPAEMGVSG
jgi:hypothetical protein